MQIHIGFLRTYGVVQALRRAILGNNDGTTI